MYLFLESISEFLDRFSLVIIGGVIGMLVIVLVWNRVPKFELVLKKAKTEYKAQIKPKTASQKKIFRTIRLPVLIIGLCLMIGAPFIGRFLGISYAIILLMGGVVYTFGFFVL